MMKLAISHAAKPPSLCDSVSSFTPHLKMPIEFACSKCKKKLKVKDELAGKKIKCPGCSSPVAVPATAAETVPADVTAEDSIAKLNLKKFRVKPVDLEEDEDLDLEQLEGAVVLRKKRELAATAKPPSEPLMPLDWILGLICFPAALIMAIVLLIQGKRSRGLKVLLLSFGMLLFAIGLFVLFLVAGVFAALQQR
jgi:DNA-directed RNA polymerase subunit RPC12/RpoP